MKYIRKTARYNEKKYEATGKTELEALTKLADKLAAAKRGKEAIGGSMTVDTWIKEWLAAYKKPKDMTKKSLGMYTEKYNGYIKPRIGRMKLKDVKDIPIHAQLRLALVKAVGALFSPVFPNRNGGHMDNDTLYRCWRSFYRELDIYMGAKVYRNEIIEHAAAQDLTPYCLRHTFCTDL